jgi:uncharacterized protein (TIGR02266 family)
MRVCVEGNSATCAGTSKNMGIGGLFVVTERGFKVGDRLSLRFEPPGFVAILTGAEVRWVREFTGGATGMGLRFVDLPVDAAVAIQEVLRKLDADLTPSWPST